MGNNGSSTLQEQHGKPDIPEITVIPVSLLPGTGPLGSEHTGLRSTENLLGQRDIQLLGQRDIQPLGQRDIQLLGQRDSQPLGQRDIQPLGQRDIQPLGQRDSQPLGQRDIQPLGQRDSQPLGQRDIQLLGQRDIQLLGQSAVGTEGHSAEDLKMAEAQLTPSPVQLVHEEGQQGTQWDSGTLSGMEDTPKGSRRHFLEVMIKRSPEVRRRMDQRGLVHLSRSVSLVSTNTEDDRTPVTLDPVEHEWMLCSSDGEWASLLHLLSSEPSLVLRKDFVTGFSCLHWAAKLGRPELIAQIVDFSRQHDIPVSMDIQSNSGYTPLHIAAMHGHLEVLKILVGAYSADVEVRDYSGRKACQYLSDSVSMDILDICGAQTLESNDHRAKGHWRFSRVLQSNLKPLKLLSADSLNGEDRPRDRPVRRQSSLSRIRPKLEKLRQRTSQIVHNASHQDQEVLESSRSSPQTHSFS